MIELANRTLTVALILLSLFAGDVYLFLFESVITGLFLPSPFISLTAFTCHGCGSTHSLHHLLHGDLVGAFQLNPLFVVALPFILYALLKYSHAVIRRRPLKPNQLRPEYIWFLFVAILSFWVFRNTPWYPFVS